MPGAKHSWKLLHTWGPLGLIATLVALQAVFTVHALSQIRYEELAESVRNPFWLSNGIIYDGISSNVGWYGLHVLLYKIFGFSLFASKWLRLGIHALSLISLAFIFNRFFRGAFWYLALLSVGVSPTLLYFNTTQASYGFDLQFFPIALMPLFVRDTRFTRFLFGVLLIFGALCWPVFMFYIPFLLLISFARKGEWLFIVLGFALPFLFFLGYLKDPLMWINDPEVHSGVFRGSGGGVVFNLKHFAGNISIFWNDLVNTGTTYYYELAVPEWGTPVSLICGLLILAFGLSSLFIAGPWRTWVLLGFGLIVTTLVMASLGMGNPGLRRGTGAIAGFYLIGLGVMLALQTLDTKLKWCGTGILILFACSQVYKIPQNMQVFEKPSIFQESWFRDLTLYRTLARNSIVLDCSTLRRRFEQCRYPEIYAALAWMNVSPIYAVLPQTNDIVKLRPELWKADRLVPDK